MSDQERYQKLTLGEIFEQHPELFEPIDLRDYASGPALENLFEDGLTEWGKKGWISFDKPDDDEEGGFQTYRFRWSDVEKFGPSPKMKFLVSIKTLVPVEVTYSVEARSRDEALSAAGEMFEAEFETNPEECLNFSAKTEVDRNR